MLAGEVSWVTVTKQDQVSGDTWLVGPLCASLGGFLAGQLAG